MNKGLSLVGHPKQFTPFSFLQENIAKETVVYTDEAKPCCKVKSYFADHDFTSLSKGEYVRGNVHTNTIEGYFQHLKTRHDGCLSSLQ